MNLYRNILLSSLKTTWKNKYLWFFGLFATLLGGTGELELIFNSAEGNYQSLLFPDYAKWSEMGIFSGTALKNMADLAVHNPLSFFIMTSLFLVVLLLGVFLVWLTVTSQAGLVYNVAKIRLDKKHSFKDGLNAGMDKFWAVLGLNFGLKLIISLFFLLLTIPIVSNVFGVSFGNKIFFLLFIFFIPLSIIVSFIVKYAIAFVVIRGTSFLGSIKASWLLFKDNWLISIEMAFILFFISFMSWIIFILFFLILAIPIIFIIFVSRDFVYMNYIVFIIAGMFLYILTIIIFGSFITAFQISSWTNLFLELIGRGGKSKLNRLFDK